MARHEYPQGIVTLDGRTKAFHRLDPYQRRRLQLLADRGIREVEIDRHGVAHASVNGVHVRVRPQRRFASALYGISLGGWINAIQHSHQISLAGWVLISCAQLLLFEAWPHVVRRHKPTLGDRAADQITKVL